MQSPEFVVARSVHSQSVDEIHGYNPTQLVSTVWSSRLMKKDCTSFCQPTQPIACANHGNHVQSS